MKKKQDVLTALLWGCAVLSAVTAVAVFIFMAALSLPVFKQGFGSEILTAVWDPGHGRFGIGAMMAGTFYIAMLSLIIGFPISLGCSFFIRIVSPRGLAGLFHGLVRFMTAIPTVVYGFVGVFLLVPLIRQIPTAGSGMCILSAALVLSVVISPTMILFFSQSMANVPQQWLNAVDAVGATPWQKLRYVILPHAFPGIVTGLILAFGRAMGDTLIALMISGNSVMMPSSVLDSARTLTSHIALVIAADFDSIEFKSIFVCGSVLYAATGIGVLAVRRMEKRRAR